MDKAKLEGNIALFVSKTFSGLNANALKYLIPVWISPLAGVDYRIYFGALAFWIISLFSKKKEKVFRKDKIELMILGALGFYVFQLTYLISLKYTTPVSVSILNSLMPTWTFLFGVFMFKTEYFTWSRAIGLIISISGAILSMFAERSPELAPKPLLGDSLAIIGSIVYSLYLIYSKKKLAKVSNISMLKWSFTGAASAALIVDMLLIFVLPLFDINIYKTLLQSKLTTPHINWLPILILLFILIFPTVISFFLLQYGLKRLSATIVASYTNVLIIVTTIVALILGQDKFNLIQMTSILMLFVGLYFVSRVSSTRTRSTDAIT